MYKLSFPNINPKIFVFYLFIYFASIFIYCTLAQEVNLKLENGYYMQIQTCSNEIFRVRYSPKNDFSETLMERYDILKTDWKEIKVNTKSEGSIYILETDGYSLIYRS